MLFSYPYLRFGSSSKRMYMLPSSRNEPDPFAIDHMQVALRDFHDQTKRTRPGIIGQMLLQPLENGAKRSRAQARCALAPDLKLNRIASRVGVGHRLDVAPVDQARRHFLVNNSTKYTRASTEFVKWRSSTVLRRRVG